MRNLGIAPYVWFAEGKSDPSNILHALQASIILELSKIKDEKREIGQQWLPCLMRPQTRGCGNIRKKNGSNTIKK